MPGLRPISTPKRQTKSEQAQVLQLPALQATLEVIASPLRQTIWAWWRQATHSLLVGKDLALASKKLSFLFFHLKVEKVKNASPCFYLKLSKLWIKQHNRKLEVGMQKRIRQDSLHPSPQAAHARSLSVKVFMKSFTTCSQRG